MLAAAQAGQLLKSVASPWFVVETKLTISRSQLSTLRARSPPSTPTTNITLVLSYRDTVPARQAGLDVYAAISDVRSLAPFDSITLWHTFEHLTDPRATLGEIRGLLSPKGVLIIAVPNAGGLQARTFGAKWFHLDVPRHLYHFTRSSLANLLRSEGFIPFREWHQEFEYDLLGWSQSALSLAPGPPNLFFDLLRGFKPPVGKLASAAAWISGSLATVLSIFLVPVGTLTRAGGTLIVASRLA